MSVIHKAKDNSAKSILSEPELFVQFIKDFTSIEILKDIQPEDIEDVDSRFIPLFSEQRDSDTVKRINLKGDSDNPLFVITIVEHESKVNFRAPFKILLYITYILEAYEKEVNKKASAEAGKDVKVTMKKDFKYPPIFPIIFYDGAGEWTAETNFLNRTEMKDIFEKYIPKFEYELVSLKEYSYEDLTKFGDILSLFMLLNKPQTAEELNSLGNLPKEYLAQIDSLNIPAHLKELVVNSVTVLLSRINAPQDEINKLLEKIDERGVSEMLALKDYDVQATRKEARAEARAEAMAEAEKKMGAMIKLLMEKGFSVKDIADTLNTTEQEITRLLLVAS